ncbi:zinc finger protein [Tripterygium wilfordii]|uniref:RING-type E3 ubiquitin transferase n=1 Tax=Tripterygium wilfordii TaxID=458696 RepID=A0A7J7CDQ2_TRIWF|nr:E3 ubiquitin-protein ligase ZNF598-like [Tripterygium wilfordii]KAF5732055.1 zinc finger protein [Tripterygium wilfordii]
MDDSCAVCAETLEWVAYGACGHRDVCSTCVARLRFICDDRRCCICKTESSVVFITKALGDYTRMINDFSVLPFEVREGQVGSYWYHEDTQAFFDDVDHYKMIKAMCRLSCSECDKMDDQPNDVSKRRGRFKNIEQLKGHLFHRHKLVMCGLCLEGRKVFICEQKLYSRSQLNQHISTGDSDVDGSESERGGFTGHPMCEFCRTPFYGDNELYMHMSTEHYTCHICQRQHPGQYEYYKNYDDLEMHFRREHFICEDEACLAKKFIVFPTEAEIKRHNAIEHGGRMSRSKRNAVLQIPTSFRYRQSIEQDRRRGGGRSFHRDPSDNQVSMAIQASLETANPDGTARDPVSSFGAQSVHDNRDVSIVDPIVQPFESLTTTDSEQPSRYRQALGQSSRGVPLGESLFPPLAVGNSSSNHEKSKQDSERLPVNTMAANLRRQNNRKATVLYSSQALPEVSRWPGLQSSSSTQHRPTANIRPATSQSSSSGPALASYAGSVLPQAQSQVRPTMIHGLPSSNSSFKLGNTGKISHSASAPNLSDNEPLLPFVSDFPPVSATQIHKMPPVSQALPKVEDVHTANKSLVEKIRAALEYDEDKYTAFKEISGRYRQGTVDTGRYLNYVQQHSLSHLVIELAMLCPDVQKRKELVDAYNASLQSNGLQANGRGQSSGTQLDDSSNSKKGKGKNLDADISNSKDALADSIISTARKLQLGNKSIEEEVEVLSKDGYRTTKGKSKVMVDGHQLEHGSANRGQNDSTFVGGGSNKNVSGGGKPQKKTSKFHRMRLGDGSVAAALDLKNSNPDPDPDSNGGENPIGMPARGVWQKKGGGQKLFSS